MKLTLIKKKEEAKDTFSFYWQPEKPFSYLPGQYVYFTLSKLDIPDKRGATRHFTLSSSPTETAKSGLIMNTTRIRDDSGYKQSLMKLSPKTTIEAEGPSGTFVLDEKTEGNHLFLIGGIGITPIRSFIKYKIDKKLNYRAHLIYSNSTPEMIVFKTEFDNWVKKVSNFSVTYTVSDPTSKWMGKSGRIDKQLINDEIRNLKFEIKNLTFWLCGPPPFVTAMEDILETMKVNSNSIISEKFSGY